jgi:hypothetical protein
MALAEGRAPALGPLREMARHGQEGGQPAAAVAVGDPIGQRCQCRAVAKRALTRSGKARLKRRECSGLARLEGCRLDAEAEIEPLELGLEQARHVLAVDRGAASPAWTATREPSTR